MFIIDIIYKVPLEEIDACMKEHVEYLDKYFAACVAGGRGSFVVVVRNYRDYAAGMRRKLVLEISQNDTPTKQANLLGAQLLHIAAAAAPNGGPPVLRPGPNQFSNQCDQTTGPFSFGNF